jgi:hypothetical protein
MQVVPSPTSYIRKGGLAAGEKQVSTLDTWEKNDTTKNNKILHSKEEYLYCFVDIFFGC